MTYSPDWTVDVDPDKDDGTSETVTWGDDDLETVGDGDDNSSDE